MLPGAFPAKPLTFSSLTKFCRHRGWLEKDIDSPCYLLLWVQTDLVMVAMDTIILNLIIFSEGVVIQIYKMLSPIWISHLKGEKNNIREAGCQERNQKIYREISELTRLMSMISWVANVLFKVIQSIENGSYLSDSHESLWHSLMTRPFCEASTTSASTSRLKKCKHLLAANILSSYDRTILAQKKTKWNERRMLWR